MNPSIKRLFIFSLLVVFLAGCAPGRISSPTPIGPQIENPNPPQSGDGKLVRDGVEIVKTEWVILKSNPLQYAIKISFFTPTPCHQFRVSLDQPGTGNRINIEVYSLMKKDQVCTLMRLNTPTEVSLGISKISAGHYSVWVNGLKALEFDA